MLSKSDRICKELGWPRYEFIALFSLLVYYCGDLWTWTLLVDWMPPPTLLSRSSSQSSINNDDWTTTDGILHEFDRGKEIRKTSCQKSAVELMRLKSKFDFRVFSYGTALAFPPSGTPHASKIVADGICKTEPFLPSSSPQPTANRIGNATLLRLVGERIAKNRWASSSPSTSWNLKYTSNHRPWVI